MNLALLADALRKGSIVDNPAQWKWAGVAVTVSIIGLNIVQTFGYLTATSAVDVVEFFSAGLVLWSQFATTKKIGILPEKPE